MKYIIIGLLLLVNLFIISCGDDYFEENQNNDGDTTADGDSSITVDGDTATDGDLDLESDASEQSDSDAEFEPEFGRISDLVNPFIGTGGIGYHVGSGLPGAAAPFGMLMVSPDTSGENGAISFYHCGGYYATDEYITGFSHTHLYGVGANEMGNIMFQPVIGEVDYDTTKEKNYRSYFEKSTETARPGYYAVTLADSDIRVELTATLRAAHHRYTYPNDLTSNLGHVIIDLSHSVPASGVAEQSILVDATSQVVEGWVMQNGAFASRYDGLKVYFYSRFNKKFSSFGTFDNESITENQTTEENDTKVGVHLAFDFEEDKQLEAQVGISYVSIEQARLNLNTEMPDFDFEATKTATENTWEEEMSVVKFSGGEEYQRIIMATALYHSFLMPDIFSDVNGKYLGFDQQVHQADGFDYYTNFSMWDTYRTLHPLLSLVKPERQRDMMISLVKMSEQGGSLPKWPFGAGYSNCMISSPADAVIADAYVKGITDFDAELAFSKMLENANDPVANASRARIEEYVENGFIYSDTQNGAVSRTQENSIADYAIAQMAAALGKDDEFDKFMDRSKNYQKLWDSETQFFRGKLEDGSWCFDEGDKFDPLIQEQKPYSPYTEGNAWQYLWLAPHDMQGLMDLFGSAESMSTKLLEFFDNSVTERESWDSITGLLPPGYYWHGNEPDIHTAYLFLQTGRPDLAQKWIHWVSETVYGTGADGLAGNDDCGTLSAWYVFSSLGFYPITGSDLYLIGRPLFDYAEVKVANGILKVEAFNASNENIYVQSVTLNGVELDKPYFYHADITDGGTLVFELGSSPSNWGVVDTIPQ